MRRYASTQRSAKSVNYTPPDAQVYTLQDGKHTFIIRPPPSQSLPTERNVLQQPIEVLPPPLKQPSEKQYNLTSAEIEEMKRLRNQDPQKWTRSLLAQKFNCSPLFVGIAAPLDKQTAGAKEAELQREQAAAKDRRRW